MPWELLLYGQKLPLSNMPCTYCGNECGGCCKSCGESQESRTEVCGCGDLATPIIDSRGDCVPVIRDEDTAPPEPYRGGVMVHPCTPSECGDKTIGAPAYKLIVTNPSDDILRDDAGNPILVNGAVALKPQN